MRDWFWGIIITFIGLLIVIFIPWLIIIALLVGLGVFIYSKFGNKDKIEFQKLKHKNKKIQIEESKKETKLKKEEKKNEKDNIRNIYNEYIEKRSKYKSKNKIEEYPYFFWNRYGILEKIFIVKKNDKTYLVNGTDNFNTFKEDYKNVQNNEQLFDLIGIVQIDEDNISINDTRHIIQDIYHYNDSTNDILLGSLLFGTAGAIAGAANSKPKVKELTSHGGNVLLTIKNVSNGIKWSIEIDISMLVTLSENFPNIIIKKNNDKEVNQYFV